MDNLNDKDMLQTVLKVAMQNRRLALKSYVMSGAIKTEGTYQRQIWRAIRELFTGVINEFDFIDDVNNMIDNQFGRAWREGAREMGVSQAQFVLGDYDELARRIAQEQNFMLQLTDDILNARATGRSIEPFRARADMWANRYNDLVNEARVWFGGRRMLEWVLGPTEHCTDCARLAGTIASADDWRQSHWKPQGRDLECGGFNCRCQLLPTDKPASSGGIPA